MIIFFFRKYIDLLNKMWKLNMPTMILICSWLLLKGRLKIETDYSCLIGVINSDQYPMCSTRTNLITSRATRAAIILPRLWAFVNHLQWLLFPPDPLLPSCLLVRQRRIQPSASPPSPRGVAERSPLPLPCTNGSDLKFTLQMKPCKTIPRRNPQCFLINLCR